MDNSLASDHPHLLPMANPPHFDRNSMMHHSSDSQNPRYLNSPNVTGSDSEWIIFQQTTSSPMLQGYNQSVYSFSAPLEPPSLLHQAASQPCPRTTRNLSTSSDYSQFPVNNIMSRSASQFSSMSSGQHAHSYNTIQALRGSFDGASPLDMTRSYSSTSDNPETVNQQPSVQSDFTSPNWHTGGQFAFAPQVPNQHATAGPSAQYQLDLNDNLGIGNGSRNQSLDWKTHTTE